MKKNSIGLAIITCNRPDLFQKCCRNLPSVDHLVIVNDGEPYLGDCYPPGAKIIQHRLNKGVGRSKNDALRSLLHLECEHIFLMEDDVQIIDPGICKKYIDASIVSNIRHLNFGYHGPKNKSTNGEPSPRIKYSYQNGATLVFNRHLVGAFSYYHANVLYTTGLMDPFFLNFMDHVDHTLRIIKKGYHPPFWWFADIEGSNEMILDLDPNQERVSIVQTETYAWNVFFGKCWFLLKHRHKPWNYPDVEEKDVTRWLELAASRSPQNEK